MKVNNPHTTFNFPIKVHSMDKLNFNISKLEKAGYKPHPLQHPFVLYKELIISCLNKDKKQYIIY